MTVIDLARATASRAVKRPATATGRMPRIALLSPVESAGLAGEWQALAAEAVEDNHFFLADVVIAAAGHFAKDVRTLCVRNSDGGLIGLAPVTATRLGRLTPALRIWSHHYGPFGVPLMAG